MAAVRGRALKGPIRMAQVSSAEIGKIGAVGRAGKRNARKRKIRQPVFSADLRDVLEIVGRRSNRGRANAAFVKEILETMAMPGFRLGRKRWIETIASQTGLSKWQVEETMRRAPLLRARVREQAKKEPVEAVERAAERAGGKITTLRQLAKKAGLDRHSLLDVLNEHGLWERFPNMQRGEGKRLREGQRKGAATRTKRTMAKLAKVFAQRPESLAKMAGLAGMTKQGMHRQAKNQPMVSYFILSFALKRGETLTAAQRASYEAGKKAYLVYMVKMFKAKRKTGRQAASST